jgi:hypothetical protein
MPSEEKTGKIDFTLIQSGFDLEILVSSRLVQIYLDSLLAAREASGEIPFGGEDHRKVLRILRLSNARFISGDSVSTDAELAVDMDYQIDSISGERIDEGVQVVYLNVRMSGLSTSDISAAQDTLTLMVSFIKSQGDIDVHDKLNDSDSLSLIVNLGAAFYQEHPIDLVPGEVHRVEIQTFPATPEHPAAMGVYVNFKFRNSPLPDDFLEFERGDLGKALNFLPQEYDYAIGVSPSVYDKLGAHIRHEYFGRTYTTPGGEVKYSYVWSDDGQEINCKAVTVLPDFRVNMHTDQNTGRTVSETVYTGGLRMNIHTHVYMSEYDINAEADIKYGVFPTEKDGVLELKLKLLDTDVDVSFWDSVRSIFMADNGNYMALWICFPIALIGVPIGGAIKWLVAEIGASLAEDELTDQLKAGTAKAQKKIATVLDYLSGRVTFLKKRMDPFYTTHFQAVVAWKEARFDEKGMRMGGTLEGAQEFLPKEQYGVNDQGEKTEELVICDKTRTRDGAIDRLVYRIADYQDIFEVDNFPRLDPVGKPDEFLLAVSEIINRIQEKRLDVMVQLYPTHVRIRDHHIYVIRFHSGLVLRPQEAGELQYIHRALRVMGYDLVRYRHTLKFYYRSERDRQETNNLWSLPHDSSLEP